MLFLFISCCIQTLFTIVLICTNTLKYFLYYVQILLKVFYNDIHSDKHFLFHTDPIFLKMKNTTVEPRYKEVGYKAKKKNSYVALTRPNLKIGSVGRDFFFFFFFLCSARELSFPIFFLKFLNGENSGGMQSKRIYKSCKCFFKPLNTNFSKFFAQIWHKKKKKKKKTDPVFSHFTVGRERAT